ILPAERKRTGRSPDSYFATLSARLQRSSQVEPGFGACWTNKRKKTIFDGLLSFGCPGRIRTYGNHIQSVAPYHLATGHWPPLLRHFKKSSRLPLSRQWNY